MGRSALRQRAIWYFAPALCVQVPWPWPPSPMRSSHCKVEPLLPVAYQKPEASTRPAAELTATPEMAGGPPLEIELEEASLDVRSTTTKRPLNDSPFGPRGTEIEPEYGPV